MSTANVRNSDLISSGSNDGFVNLYRLNKDDKKLEIVRKIDGMPGCINSMKFSYPSGNTDLSNLMLAATHSKEDRLGRWHVVPGVKTGITIIRKH